MVTPYVLPDAFVGHNYQLALYFELRVCVKSQTNCFCYVIMNMVCNNFIF
jgi:hypothetical protein